MGSHFSHFFFFGGFLGRSHANGSGQSGIHAWPAAIQARSVYLG